MQRIIIILFIILTPALPAQAASRYVTDQILIALRPVQDDTAPPLEYLATGTRVEVLEDLGTFLKIKSASGSVGFARSKYFIPTPPAGATTAAAGVQEQLTAALKRIAELTAEVQRLRAKPADLITTEVTQKQEKGRSETAAIVLERDQLKRDIARLKEISEKSTNTSTPPELSQLQWFLAGAAILLLGWFAGKSSRSKRRF